jgi:hypothetical protein
MSIPNTRVYVQFNLEASSAAFFTLDDSVQGVLDSPYGLGGDVLEDVTQFVAGITIDRGKSRELDRFSSGQLKVAFHNDNRWFDPFYVDSPYFEQFVPKRQVVITSNGVVQYTGYIDDIDLEYNLGNRKSYAYMKCSDSFTQLTSTLLNGFTNTVEKTGERINVILDRPEVAWPASLRNIDTGQQTLQADLVTDGTNTLSYLQLVESSEPGSLFIDKSGRVAFKDRSNQAPLTDTIVFSDTSVALGVNYDNIQVLYGTENLYNRISVTRIDGTAQVVDNLDSQAIYGIQALYNDGLLMETDADALDTAEFLLNQYALPELRFTNIGFTLEDKTSLIQNDLLALEIGDVIRIRFTPNGIGDPIDQYQIITGVSHEIGINSHLINFDFGTSVGLAFALDSDIYGVLGGNLPLYDDIATSYDSDVKYDGSPIDIQLYGLGY